MNIKQCLSSTFGQGQCSGLDYDAGGGRRCWDHCQGLAIARAGMQVQLIVLIKVC